MSVALTARKLSAEEYVQVQGVLVRSFLKVPNRTLHYRTAFRNESMSPRPLDALVELYDEHLAAAVASSVEEGNHLSVGASQSLEELREKLEDALTYGDVEPLLS